MKSTLKPFGILLFAVLLISIWWLAALLAAEAFFNVDVNYITLEKFFQISLMILGSAFAVCVIFNGTKWWLIQERRKIGQELLNELRGYSELNSDYLKRRYKRFKTLSKILMRPIPGKFFDKFEKL